MNEIKDAAKIMTENELKWNKNWDKSIQKILELY